MKILKHLRICIIAISLLIQSCTATPKSITTELDLPTLIPYRDGKLWGYCDKDKNIKIKPEYDKVSFFNELGLARVFKENPDEDEIFENPFLIGVIDKLGNKIIPIKNYKGFKIINYDGGNKDKYGPFDAVVYGNFQIILINKDYKNFKGDGYEFIYEFEPENLSFNPNIILLHEKYDVGTVYNRNGDAILHDSFTIVVKSGSPKSLVTAECYFEAQHKTQKYFQVFDKNGKLLNNKKFKEVTRLNDTLYIGRDAETNLKTLYHISGKILFSNFLDINKVLEKFTPEMGLISLVNRTDEALYSLKLKKFILHSTKYEYGKISNDVGSIVHKNIFYHNKMLLINYGKDKSEFGLFSNETGEMIVKGYPQMNVDFSFQLIMAKNNKTINLYDFESNLLNVFQNVDTVIPISQKHFLISRDNKVGVWSQQTKSYIIDIAFDNIDFSLPDAFLALGTDEKITVYDSLGNKIFPQQFTKHKVLIEDIGLRGCWPNFRNLNNKHIIDIKSFLVFSGNSKSMQYGFSREGNINNRRHYEIINFYNDDYDRILKELKKELITVVLEDGLGSRYRLMPDYSLKPLAKDADLVYRIMDVYFYGKSKYAATFFIDGNNKKHIAKMTKIEYSRNQPLMIIESGNSRQFYAFDPETNKRSSNTFEYLEIKYVNDTFYYYGISGNQKLMLSNKMEVIQKFPSSQEFVSKRNTYAIYSTNPNFLIDMFLVNNKGTKIFNNTCMISPTSYKQLVELVSCNNNYYNQEFLGYANINGTKYFKN